MICGVGTDLVQIARIEKAIQNERFLARVYTPLERAYASSAGKRAETYAGLFAAKEAAAKALGTGFLGFGLADIEILHDERHAPSLRLLGGAKQCAQTRGVCRSFVSISHERCCAAAVVILEG